MEHQHTHHHHSDLTSDAVNTAFIIGIFLNFIFVVIEVGVGIAVHSLSLISDAGHNLADVGALALSLFAFKLMKVKSNARYTYGYRKTSILVALFNAMILLVSIGAIVYEAAHRILDPQPLPGKTIAIVAGIGIVINACTALLFMRDKDKDLNIKSAYLHLMSDAMISLGLVVGGIVIFYTHWFWIDSLFSILIAVVILVSTWRLLQDSIRPSLDGVPVDIHLDDIKSLAQKIPGIQEIHHIHIWAISTKENALTAHLVLSQNTSPDQEQKIKHKLKHELEHQNIHHITLETERAGEECESGDC
ncbi:MAG: cation diffusion facilitator family transporter [Saprospiraceae bacterium]